MSGFGGAPAFGAQALSDATGQASPFGAPSISSTSPFPQQSISSQPPAFGTPSTFFPQSQASGSAASGSSNATNAPGSTFSNGGGPFGGSNTLNKGATMSNPFAAAMAAPVGAVSNPFGTQSHSTTAASNPFAALNSSSTTATNPFGSVASSSPFASLSNNTNSAPTPAFGQPTQQSNSAASPFANPATSIQKRKNAFEDKNDLKRTGATFANAFQKPQTSFASPAAAHTPNAFGGTDKQTSIGFASSRKEKGTSGFTTTLTAPTRTLAATGQKKSPSLYEQEIHEQLRKNNIKPPSWPSNPGNPDNMKAMDDHRVKYKAYESRVRASLIKAGLIDDPEVRKKLSDAIDFRGVCEDMCPEGEKISRIVEHDVKLPERIRNPGGHGDGWPNPDLMVKSFKRSAAGVDSPLPTEVRSPAALRRTLNYLIDDLLVADENLPLLHGFLWDRTRAIRKDFIFQNAMTAEERIDQIYCLENITRFHAVSLQLLSKEGKADFSEQQEREQLGKTLLSLIQVYDECKDMDIHIENEAEFRSYFLLYNAFDPFVIQQMQDWNDSFWFDSPEIQTAVSLIELLQNVWHGRGPMRPLTPLTLGSQSFSSYFAIVESPEVSYTMACLAGVHFTEVRRLMLKALHKSYARVRGNPKDLTVKVLNEMFRFDTEEECLAFLKEYDMQFSSDGSDEPYMIVERKRSLPRPTIKHSFSQRVIERKRGSHSLPEVVHTTIFEEASAAVGRVDSAEGLFVTQAPEPPMITERKSTAMDMSFTDDESPSSSPAPTRQGIALPPTSLANGFTFQQETAKTEVGAPPKNPFFPQLSNAATPTLTQTERSAAATQPAANPWASSTPSTTVFQNPSAPDQSQQRMFTSWTSGSAAAHPPTTQGSGSVFDFLSKPTEQPQAPLSANAVPTPATASRSLFPSLPPSEKKGKSTGTTTAMPATKPSDESHAAQGISTTPASIFAAPAASTPSATPFSSAPIISTPTPPAHQSSEVAKTQVSETMPASSPDPVPVALTPVSATQSLPPPKPKDMMGDFTTWIVLGDNGLMEQLEERLVEDILRDTFENFQQDERERQQREDDEKALAEALAHRKYSLRLKYFYRWQHNAKRKFARKAAKKNRVLLKEWREAKAAEAKAAKIEKDKEERSRQKRLTGPASWLDELDKERSAKRARRESMSLDTSRRTSPADSEADALLATGIFGSMPNQREVAANCVRDDDSLYDALVGVQISPASKGQVMGPPAKPVKDPLRSVRDGGISKTPKKQWSRKAQALKDLISGKKEDDDLLSFRSSTSSRLGQSVRSVPSGKVTNFSKYQSSSPRSSAEPDRPSKGSSSGIKSSYWLLRSRGLFATPAGHILSDRVPQPRSGPTYDQTSQYSGDSENGDYDDRVLEQDSAYRASLGLNGGQTGIASRRSTFSLGAAGSPPRLGFMKPKPSSLRQSLPAGGISTPMLLDTRSQRGEADGASQAGSTTSTMQQDVEETLRELRKVAAELEEETDWLREQNSRMSQGRDFSG